MYVGTFYLKLNFKFYRANRADSWIIWIPKKGEKPKKTKKGVFEDFVFLGCFRDYKDLEKARKAGKEWSRFSGILANKC
jgi:hypothetical protein